MPQDDGASIPFDISVTALIPSVYEHVLLLLERFGIERFDTRFNYSVRYRGGLYATTSTPRSGAAPGRDREVPAPARVAPPIRWLTHARSKLLNALNPFNYISMGAVLNLGGFSADFRTRS